MIWTPMSARSPIARDITYGTNNEFGFDYLRDNMVTYKENLVQRELNFAIVDEVDSILIDEARTPLIISGRGEKSTEMYSFANQFVARGLRECIQDKEGNVTQPGDYIKDDKDKTISLTEDGVRKAEAFFQRGKPDGSGQSGAVSSHSGRAARAQDDEARCGLRR